ncbi:MAG: hypothetical protein PHQ70_08695 [Arcobacter sp.]|uniref:hypothetical protein n=1 Tax=Arcobacter sp. TaxID=1872629 RepID=UPI002589405A|nr:hypothetical protein [Arcobacter sp.]MDD3008929.1 hypothetical protein [Arcobacter sp.]
MKKVLVTTALLSSYLLANSEISTYYTYKDYDNSKTKTEGKTLDYRFLHNFQNSELTINYEDSLTKRENELTKIKMTSLEIEKLSMKYLYHISNDISIKTSFINIEDNLAPSDNGKIYGLGFIKSINNSNEIKIDTYLSNYDDFNVNQYDLTFVKKFKFNDINFMGQTGIKYIDINGSEYGNYNLKNNYYTSYFLNLNANYNGFIFGLGFMNGDRLFAVLEDGLKVEHHALEQNKTYVVSLGKKFKNIDLISRYIYSNSNELPENRKDVKSQFVSLGLKYKFSL